MAAQTQAAHRLCILPFSCTQEIGDDGASACTQHGAYGSGKTKHWPHHGNCRYLSIVSQHGNEEHIRHVVDHHNQNGQHRRYRQGENGFPHRLIPE